MRLYATPRIGHLPVQAVRPSTITKLYRDLLTSGGRDSQPLAVTTVTHLHAVLRKGFRDAVGAANKAQCLRRFFTDLVPENGPVI